MTKLEHQHFKAWLVDAEYGPAVTIQQNDGHTDESVMLHSHQLRHVCEHFGILAADPLAKTVTALQRRMLALRDRINSLSEYMATCSDHEHADLSHEMAHINMLADLANEWCADFLPDETTSTPADSAPPQKSNPSQAEQASLI